jgi:hypothetical protein
MSGSFRGMNAEEFYRLRDERTALLVGDDIRSRARLTLSISQEEARTFGGQLCFLLLVNLSARWCRHIGIQISEAGLHPDVETLFGSASLSEAALAVAEAADPFGSFQLKPLEEASSHIHVGADAPKGAFPIMGRGWIAATGEGVGACRSLREALCHPSLRTSVRLSLWNYGAGADAIRGPALQPFDLGRILVVGTGAIGSSIAYLLPLLRARIENVHLIDADVVELPNLNRALMFMTNDVESPKVEAVSRHLEKFGITASSTSAWFSEAAPDLGTYDLVVPGANEFGVQQGMMSNYPPLMIGASTGPQWDIHLQRHIPLIDDCLECRIPSERPKPLLRCGSGEMSVPDDPGAPRQTGALPFLSFAASLMALAEIAKLGVPDAHVPDENGVLLFFKVPELSFMTLRHVKKSDCQHCWDNGRFHRLRSAGKFYNLSKTNGQ